MYIRELDELEAKPIAGTREGFFSPDGNWILFFDKNQLKKLHLEEGSPLTIAEDAKSAAGAYWGANDQILFGRDSELCQVSAGGGRVRTVSKPHTGYKQLRYRTPEILPGGKSALFTIWSGFPENAAIGLIDLESGEEKVLVDKGMSPRYSHSGHIVYTRADGTLLAVPFDLSNLQSAGSPVAFAQRVKRTPGAESVFSISENGTLVYIPFDPRSTEILMVNTGGGEKILLDEKAYYNPRFSPDGKKIAFVGEERGRSPNIWIFDLQRRVELQLTFEGRNGNPSWSPDGKRIVFHSNMGGDYDIYATFADGTGAIEPLLEKEGAQYFQCISPDERYLIFTEMDPEKEGFSTIQVLPLSGDAEPYPFIQSRYYEQMAEISPDGHWLAYVSNESGHNEVYVQGSQ
jgi:hypothetical protein